jgi:hypothetical protein
VIRRIALIVLANQAHVGNTYMRNHNYPMRTGSNGAAAAAEAIPARPGAASRSKEGPGTRSNAESPLATTGGKDCLARARLQGQVRATFPIFSGL